MAGLAVAVTLTLFAAFASALAWLKWQEAVVQRAAA